MYTSLGLVVLAGLLGPLLAAGRRPRVPVLVGELIGGILLGRAGLNLIDPSTQPFPRFPPLGFPIPKPSSGARDGPGPVPLPVPARPPRIPSSPTVPSTL